jgi:hypothetical protein
MAILQKAGQIKTDLTPPTLSTGTPKSTISMTSPENIAEGPGSMSELINATAGRRGGQNAALTKWLERIEWGLQKRCPRAVLDPEGSNLVLARKVKIEHEG